VRFKRPTVIESEPAFMNNYTLMGLLVVMIAFMWWSSRSRKKQMEKMEQDKREQLAAVTPGEWVRTRVGFWGRFVDLDGDIVVLETTDGHEMTGDARTRPGPGAHPPLASTEDDEATDGTKTEEINDEDEAILGLDDAPSSKDSDEQQK